MNKTFVENVIKSNLSFESFRKLLSFFFNSGHVVFKEYKDG